MSKVVIRGFGGMVPVVESRLLPEYAAEETVNTWLTSGCAQGLREPVAVHDCQEGTRTVFRIPKSDPSVEAMADSYWLEFEAVNTTVVRSPISDTDDARYYWANGVDPPGYTTFSRIRDGKPPLRLGIPSPIVPPTIKVIGGGGVGPGNNILTDRVYIYTWLSEYHEEGAPGPPSDAKRGFQNGMWEVTLAAPSPADVAQRALKYTRIYRTVTTPGGTAAFHFVAEIPITQLIFNDAQPDTVIGFNDQLISVEFTGPPEGLEGMVSLPNGMIAGWVGQQLWYCEPFRPHAWPPSYQTSVDFPIVGMAAYGEALVIGTQNVAFLAIGVNPLNVTLVQITGSEPCVSTNSFAVTPQGVLYAGPNGLMMNNGGGATNISREFMSTDKWQELLKLKGLSAALLNGAYYCYGGVEEQAFQADAFQNDAFQTAPSAATDGALIEYRDKRIGYTILRSAELTYKVLQDVWTSEVLLVRGNKVWHQSIAKGDKALYEWRSKLFQLPLPQNYSCMKIVWSPGGPSNVGTVEYYANNALRLTRAIPASSKPFRLPAGYKVDSFQIRITGDRDVDQIEIASTMRELGQV